MPARTPKDVKQIARAHTAAAIKVLVGIMNQPKSPAAARVSAANVVLDRGWGKPAQTVAVGGDPEGVPIIFKMSFGDGLKPGD